MNTPRPVALITGGARRVGRQIARAFAAHGYDIAFTYNNSHREADELADLLRGLGSKALPIRADLTEPETSVAQIAAGFSQEFPRLDVLVNNASLYLPGGLADAAPDNSRRLWAIHVIAPLLLCRAFEAQLRSAAGHVVNMVDIQAERPMPSYAIYCASKAALWNLTLSLAKDLAPEVTVNAIAPGVVEWPEDFPEAEKAKYLRRVPLGRAGTPQEVAAAVLFLCRDATYVTGQMLRLDGGRSLT
jgi:pteridine reductase